MRYWPLMVPLVGIMLSGCVTTSHQQITALKRSEAQSRIVVMPLDVELAELSAGGLPEPKSDWSNLALHHMATALRAERESRNLQLIEYNEQVVDSNKRDELRQLLKLHGAVGQSIIVHQYIPSFALPTKAEKFDWSLGPSARSLREAYGADYALFIFVRDSYSSAGRTALIIFGALLGVGIPGGAQLGFASLVDLETGNVVWFNRLLRPHGDLRTEPAARETVQTLLTNLPQ